MRIEFLEHSSDGPVVLIWGDEPENVAVLRRHVRELAAGALREFAVHELPGFEAVDGCTLTFGQSQRDIGLYREKDGGFVCRLRGVWFENVEGLLEPFCRPHSGTNFQFLDYGSQTTRTSLLISTAREW